ncbi:hypothetical protein [Duganella callida]|uniref:Uncharacterized protein n=1 Tax=Duganella callida TaxID=2561932 RepID=A0A4Y9T0K2_9BURK|nr:hypothetical protein [Duganella callida]TFW31371.1 hypothetical protein E4L98_00300 [Duganella callida]
MAARIAAPAAALAVLVAAIPAVIERCQRRSVIQVAELIEQDDWQQVERDRPTRIDLACDTAP